VGKSRLLHEFVHSSDTRGWLVLESTSVSYGRSTPYLPVIEFLKTYFEIDSPDDAQTIREKVTARILSTDASLQDAIPPLLDSWRRCRTTTHSASLIHSSVTNRL
jgi:hypothetical protein